MFGNFRRALDKLARSRWFWPGLVAVIAAILIAPIWFLTNEPTLDGPSHLGELYVLLNVQKDPILSHYYQVDWALVPNLAGELVVSFLTLALPLTTAIKVFVSLGALLWVAGTAMIQRALFGRLHATALIGALFVYNTNLVAGFWNLYFGLGLTLVLFAVWIRWSKDPSPWRLLFFAAATVIVYFCHFVAALALLFLLIGFEAPRVAASARPWQTAGRLLLRLGAIWLPVAGLLLLRPHGHASSEVVFNLIGAFPQRFGSVLKTGLNEPQWILVLVLIIGAAAGIFARKLYIHPAMRPLLIAFALICLAVPVTAVGGWGIHQRYPALLFSVLFAATEVRLTATLDSLMAGAAMLLSAVLSMALNANWQFFDKQATEYRTALRVLPAGSKVLLAADDTPHRRSDSSLYWHFDTYATVDRQAFSSLLLTTRGQHIVHPTREFGRIAALSSDEGSPPPLSGLAALRMPETDRADAYRFHRNYLDWPCQFDFAAIVELGERSHVEPAEFELIHRGSFFALFRIHKPARCAQKT